MLSWPGKQDWAGLALSAELLAKGVAHPLRWACRQTPRDYGALVLRRNIGE